MVGAREKSGKEKNNYTAEIYMIDRSVFVIGLEHGSQNNSIRRDDDNIISARIACDRFEIRSRKRKTN